jgi:Fe-S cluster assembly ATP-binding protein
MLELIDIEYKIKNKVVLNKINLTIDKNNVLVITGHNGSGKSTLLKIIMGIIKPTSGKILLNGQDITKLKINERADLGLTFTFQTPITFKGITVFDLLLMANKKYPTYVDMKEALGGVGLCARDYIDREVDSSLSGGELKRIELATALIKKGNFLMLDEPEAGIDLWSFDSLVTTIKNIKSKNKLGMIIVSHQQKILDIADDILVLENGNIKMHDKKRKVLRNLKSPGGCRECKMNY